MFGHDHSQSSHENECAAEVGDFYKAVIFGNENAVDWWADENLVFMSVWVSYLGNVSMRNIEKYKRTAIDMMDMPIPIYVPISVWSVGTVDMDTVIEEMIAPWQKP